MSGSLPIIHEEPHPVYESRIFLGDVPPERLYK